VGVQNRFHKCSLWGGCRANRDDGLTKLELSDSVASDLSRIAHTRVFLNRTSTPKLPVRPTPEIEGWRVEALRCKAAILAVDEGVLIPILPR
jgi:hypothetical protein